MSQYPLYVTILTKVGISGVISNMFAIPGYKMYTQLRCNKKGIIVYILEDYHFEKYNVKTSLCGNVIGR